MSVLLLSLRLALAAVLGAAALAKLSDIAGFRSVLRGFGLPQRLGATPAVALPLVELAVAAVLVVSPATQAAAIGAGSLLVAFTTAVAAALTTGRRPSCGCFGGERPIEWRTLARNTVLLTAALAVSISGAGVQAPLAAEVAASVALVLGVLLIASYRCLRRRGEELLRRDALDVAAAEAETAPVGAVVAVAALVAARAAAARPADDLEALRTLFAHASPKLVRSARREREAARGGQPRALRRQHRPDGGSNRRCSEARAGASDPSASTPAARPRPGRPRRPPPKAMSGPASWLDRVARRTAETARSRAEPLGLGTDPTRSDFVNAAAVAAGVLLMPRLLRPAAASAASATCLGDCTDRAHAAVTIADVACDRKANRLATDYDFFIDPVFVREHFRNVCREVTLIRILAQEAACKAACLRGGSPARISSAGGPAIAPPKPPPPPNCPEGTYFCTVGAGGGDICCVTGYTCCSCGICCVPAAKCACCGG